MADVFDEISDDLRHENLKAFWKENGNWIIGSAIFAVILTGALAFWNQWKMDKNLARTTALIEAVKSGDPLQLANLPAKGADQDIVAKLLAAGLHVQKKEPEKAAALYKSIASSGAKKVYRDLAALMGISLRLDLEDPATLESELVPLSADGSPWRFSAREMRAALYARQGKMKEAADVLTTITGDTAAPLDIRTRAFSLRDFYLAETEKK